MRTNNVPIDDVDKPELSKEPDSTPVGSFTTTGVLGNLGGRRVYVAVISPETEQPNGHFSLSRRQAETHRKTISDIVELFNKQARRKDPARL